MQWLLTRKVWLLNTRKVHLAHFFKKVDIVRFNSKPSICYVAVSGFCKAYTNITFDAPCICVAFVTVTASGMLTTMNSHIIFCKRGKPKQGINK